MQSFKDHLDPDNSVAIFGKHNIQRSFGFQEKENESTFSFFKLENILGYKKATFISKLNYWLNKCGRITDGLSGKWIYNPTYEWAEQLNCSQSTVKRLIKSLEEQGIVLSEKVNAKKYNQTKWYSLNYKLLKSILKLENTDTKESEKKWINRLGQNEPITISNSRNNYTNTSSTKNRNKYLDHKEEEINISNQLKETKDQQPELTANELRLVEQMVELWNKVFSCSISPIKAYVSKNNRKTMFNVLNKHFAGDLSEWIGYARKVNSSQFLMGEKETKKNFKATFSWLMKPETIEKIMNDEYGVGDRELDEEREKRIEGIKKEGRKRKEAEDMRTKIEETKEVILKKVEEKMDSYVEEKLNTENVDIEEELLEYLKNREYAKDGDKYSIFKEIRGDGLKAIFGDRESLFYEFYLERAIQTYASNKYGGFNAVEYSRKIKEYLEELSKKRVGYDLLGELQVIEGKIHGKDLISSGFKEIGW